MKRWTRIKYYPNLPLEEGKYVTCSKEHRELARNAAKEGIVLLKNKNNLLPVKKGTNLAVFGRGVADYVKGGGGSGVVLVKKETTLYEALSEYKEHVSMYAPLYEFYEKEIKKQYDAGLVPGMTYEPELPEELFEGAREFADTAMVVISRFSGEGWDRSDVEYFDGVGPDGDEKTMPRLAGKYYPDGDFYITKEEKALISKVKDNFENIIVVLNIGGVIDTQWCKEDAKIGAVLNIWQGGMEGAQAAAEILLGYSNPCGKLVDTFAKDINSYPSGPGYHESVEYVNYVEDVYVGYRYFETIPGAKEEVCYPFGFGLSYTTFDIETLDVCETNDCVKFQVKVTNTGNVSGKEVVQIYYSAPQGLLGKPAKELGAFAKTKELGCGEGEILSLEINKFTMASYDDLGKVQKSAYVLEKGEYAFYVGNSVADCVKASYVMTLSDDMIMEQLSSKLVPSILKERMLSDGSFEALPQTECNDMNACVLEKMVSGTEEGICPPKRARAHFYRSKCYVENAIVFEDVAEGKASLDDFVEQLSDEDLIHLLGGQPNLSVADTNGIGNLPEYGVPSVMTADGPAGLRLMEDRGVFTTAWPCSTQMACAWNTELARQVGEAAAKEVKENNIGVWLAPALNIHRHPLCGRNFEYYSEDPYITGTIGTATVEGVQSVNIAATIKHFACNNKETNRKNSDSRLSERALREIYLKGFEMIVKKAKPWAIMSSYNIINGHRASESKELLEDILRGEWGYEGVVMSDWWTRGEHYKEILAGNDLKMACGFPERVAKAMELGAIERDDLIRSAKRVLGLILNME